jgi:N-acetylglucosaminyl-diphospho-decaprenol L-rhamnosyltransferase
MSPGHLVTVSPCHLRKGPDVSVCIVNRNCRAHLRACLRSLDPARQGARVEVVVVDNGSGDGSADMVARRFPHAVLLRNPTNEGFARGNNRAAAAARGRFLFFLNNDTVLPPGTVRKLLAFARAHPEVGIVGPRLRDDRGRTQRSARGRPTLPALLHRLILFRWTGLFRRAYRRYSGRGGAPGGPRSAEVLMGAALLMPRRVFRACGGWDEGYTFGGEDIELCLRVGRSHPVVYHPGVAVVHHGRVSTRRHIADAYPRIAAGIARSLRAAGCPAWGVRFYKLAFTADAPLQWLAHGCQYLWRRLRGQRARARKSRLVLRGLSAFLLRGLPAFWKA